MVVDLEKELIAALSAPTVQAAIADMVRAVVREELALAGLGDELLDVPRAARYLGMTPAALWKATHRGTIPCLRLGRRVRFRRRDLLTHARASRRP